MKTGHTLFMIATLITASVAGCDDDAEPVPGVGGEGGTGGEGGNGGEGGAPPSANIRVAHLSPDAPSVDVCLRGGDETIGPIMAETLMRQEGLAYTQVTRYVEVPAGTYDILLVEAGAPNCAAPLPGIPQAEDVILTGRGYATAAVIGEVAAGAADSIRIATYADSLEVPNGKAKLRAIHAAPGTPSVDVGTGVQMDFTAIFTGISFGQAGIADGRTYYVTDPLEDVTLTVRPTGTDTDLLTVAGYSLPAGGIETVFAIGNGTAETPLETLLCNDRADPMNNLTQCRRVP